MEHGCTILLDHDRIQSFYASTNTPNIDEIRRRDEFLRQISETTPYHMDGTDIVAEIPNISWENSYESVSISTTCVLNVDRMKTYLCLATVTTSIAA